MWSGHATDHLFRRAISALGAHPFEQCDFGRLLLGSTAEDGEAKELLGGHFRELNTPLEPAIQAHAYDRAVLDLELPEQAKIPVLGDLRHP